MHFNQGLNNLKRTKNRVYPFELINTLLLKIIWLLPSHKMNRGANVSVLSRSEETRFLEEKSALKRQLKLPLQLGLKIKLYKREKIKLTFFFLNTLMISGWNLFVSHSVLRRVKSTDEITLD